MRRKIKTREPILKTREDDIQTQTKEPKKPRRYIPASQPTICPECGHNTRMDDGRYVDPVRKTILEYRTCAHCNIKLAAGRLMTEREAEKLCSRIDAISEYEQTCK